MIDVKPPQEQKPNIVPISDERLLDIYRIVIDAVTTSSLDNWLKRKAEHASSD